MGIKTSYECDICHTEKKDSNNWYMVSVESCILIWPFKQNKLDNKVILCGEACVHKFISQNLATLHPPKEPVIEDHYREVGLG